MDIAKGNLEEARTPELAIDISVKTPTTPAINPKVSPPIVWKSVCIGLISVANIDASTLPTNARATKQYIVVIKNNEMIIVSGRFFAGFFISPAIAAIFVTPA